MKVEIISIDSNMSAISTLPKAAATDFIKGQLVSFESSNCVHMNADTEDVTFVGVCAMDARNSETEVSVAKKCIVTIDSASAAYEPHSAVEYSAGGATTDYSVTAGTTTNDIGRVHGNFPAASTRIRVRFDIDELNKFPTAIDV